MTAIAFPAHSAKARRVPAFTPASLASLTLWLDERDQTIVAGSPSHVSDWGDESGAAHNLATVTSGTRPQGGATINSLAAPLFVAADSDQLRTAALMSALTGASAWHLFLVFEAASHVAADGNFYGESVVVGDLGGYWGVGLSVSGIHAGMYTGAGTKQTAYDAISDATPYLFEAYYNGTKINSRLANGILNSISSGDAADRTSVLCLGNAAGAKFDGKIASLILCSAELSGADQTNTRAYLGTKYGVTY